MMSRMTATPHWIHPPTRRRDIRQSEGIHQLVNAHGGEQRAQVALPAAVRKPSKNHHLSGSTTAMPVQPGKNSNDPGKRLSPSGQFGAVENSGDTVTRCVSKMPIARRPSPAATRTTATCKSLLKVVYP